MCYGNIEADTDIAADTDNTDTADRHYDIGCHAGVGCLVDNCSPVEVECRVGADNPSVVDYLEGTPYPPDVGCLIDFDCPR